MTPDKIIFEETKVTKTARRIIARRRLDSKVMAELDGEMVHAAEEISFVLQNIAAPMQPKMRFEDTARSTGDNSASLRMAHAWKRYCKWRNECPKQDMEAVISYLTGHTGPEIEGTAKIRHGTAPKRIAAGLHEYCVLSRFIRIV